MVWGDIVLWKNHQYPLRVEKKLEYSLDLFQTTSYDIVVNDLFTRDHLGSDSLIPCVMYLQTDASVIPYVIMLDNSVWNLDDQFLLDIDDSCLMELDMFRRRQLRMALQSEKIDFDTAMIIELNHADFSLLCQLDVVDLQVAFSLLINQMGLDIHANITSISYISDVIDSDLKLYDDIHENVLLTIYVSFTLRSLMAYDPDLLTKHNNNLLMNMDNIRNELKLTTSSISTDIEFSITCPDAEIPLQNKIDSVLLTYPCYLNTNNYLNLNSALEIINDTFINPIPYTFRLEENKLPPVLSYHVDLPEESIVLKTELDYIDLEQFILIKDEDFALQNEMEFVCETFAEIDTELILYMSSSNMEVINVVYCYGTPNEILLQDISELDSYLECVFSFKRIMFQLDSNMGAEFPLTYYDHWNLTLDMDVFSISELSISDKNVHLEINTEFDTSKKLETWMNDDIELSYSVNRYNNEIVSDIMDKLTLSKIENPDDFDSNDIIDEEEDIVL